MKTTVVNLRDCKDKVANDVAYATVDIVRIDRRTIFGNPFKAGEDGDREQCIAKYKIYFYALVRNSSSFRERVLALKGKKLGCWCKPKACHGDVIVEYLERIKNA